MSKKRKSGDTASLTDSNCVDDLITPQYRHIKELSALKYEAEEKREQNLIQQSNANCLFFYDGGYLYGRSNMY